MAVFEYIEGWYNSTPSPLCPWLPVTPELREEQSTSCLNAKPSTVHGNGATPNVRNRCIRMRTRKLGIRSGIACPLTWPVNTLPRQPSLGSPGATKRREGRTPTAT